MRGTGYCMGEEVLGCVNWRISGGSGGQESCVDGSRVGKEVSGRALDMLRLIEGFGRCCWRS